MNRFYSKATSQNGRDALVSPLRRRNVAYRTYLIGSSPRLIAIFMRRAFTEAAMFLGAVM